MLNADGYAWADTKPFFYLDGFIPKTYYTHIPLHNPVAHEYMNPIL